MATSRTNPRAMRSDARRNTEQLLTSAREVFAAKGLQAPLEEIARRADVSVGTLYNRFGSRATLVDAVMVEPVEATVRSVEQALAVADPWQGLVDHFVVLADWMATDRGLADVCVYTLPPGSKTEQAKSRGAELTAALVERAQLAGVLRPDVTVADLGLLIWAVLRATEGIRDAAPDAWRRHLALLFDGLHADAAHQLPAGPLDPEMVRQAMTFG